MKKKKVLSQYLVLLPFVILIICYELLPLSQLIINGFREKTGAITLHYFLKVFTTPIYQSALWNSVRISLLSALIGLIVAFFAAKSYYEVSPRFQKRFAMLLNMTSNFTGVPLTFSFMILMGNTGVLTLLGKELNIGLLGNFNLYSGFGLTLIYIYFQIPLATLLMLPAFLGLKKEWRESAMLLQAGGIRYWMKIGIPNLLPAILGTLSVLFANALAAYATAYALVLNNYALLALQISSKFKGDVRIDKQMGGALATVLILVMVAATLFHNYLTKKYSKGRALL